MLAPAAFSAAPSSPLSSSAASTNSSLAMKLVAALLRQLVGEIEQARQVVGDIDIAFLTADSRQPVQRLADALAQGRHVDAGLRQQRRGRAALLVEQRTHQVHRLDHVVVAPDGQRLRVGQRLLKTRSQFVHPHEKAPKSRSCGERREMGYLCGLRGGDSSRQPGFLARTPARSGWQNGQ